MHLRTNKLAKQCNLEYVRTFNDIVAKSFYIYDYNLVCSVYVNGNFKLLYEIKTILTI